MAKRSLIIIHIQDTITIWGARRAYLDQQGVVVWAEYRAPLMVASRTTTWRRRAALLVGLLLAGSIALLQLSGTLRQPASEWRMPGFLPATKS